MIFHRVMYWICFSGLTISTVLGVAGVWLPRTELGGRLFATSLVLTLASGIGAAITKWLH